MPRRILELLVEIQRSPQEVAQLVAGVLQADLTEIDHTFQFIVRAGIVSSNIPSHPFELKQQDVENALTELADKRAVDETAICDGHVYEVLVREERDMFRPTVLPLRQPTGQGKVPGRPMPPGSGRPMPFELTDSDNSIKYTLWHPSNEYLVFLLDSVGENVHLARMFGPSRPGGWRGVETVDAFEALRTTSPRFLPRKKLNSGLAGGRLRRSGAVRISSYFRTL